MIRKKRRTPRQNAWRQWKARQRKQRLRSAVKRETRAAEVAVIVDVRALCVDRDGYCRLGRDGQMREKCSGPSEWAHLDENRRFNTRGMAPEERHNTLMTAMFCRRHHRLYDRHVFDLVFLTENYADGALAAVYRDSVSEF